MPDGEKIPFDYIGAKKAGYSDQEIQGFLKNKYNFDYDLIGAKKSGYSDREIADYITAYEPPKKKDISTGLAVSSAMSGINSLFGSGVPSTEKNDVDEKEKLTNYLQGLKTPEEKELAQPSAANSRQLAYNTGQQQLGKIISTGGHEDPMAVAKKNSEDSPDMHDRIKNYMANRFIEDKVDGVDAKAILANSDFGSKGNENLTATTLRQKVNKYDKSVAPIKERLSSIKSYYGGNLLEQDLSKHNQEYLDFEYKQPIDDAAVSYYANKNPDFKKELESGVKTTDFKVGQAREAMLIDPDVLSMITKEHPNLLPAFKNAQDKLILDHPEYGVHVVASEVSRAVNKTGFNNIDPYINYYGEEHKKMADQVANQLYRDQPDKLAIWNKYIKDNQEQHLDSPSFLGGVASAGKQFGQGIVNTLTEPFTSISQDVKDKWKKEAQNISADPDGFQKFLSNTGHALGTVLSIAATGNVVGNTTAVGIGFFGDILKEKKLKFDNPVTAYTSAFLNTGLFMLMGSRVFPANKVKAAFGEINPEVDEVVKNLASGKITRDVAKEQFIGLGKKAIDFAGGTLSKNAKITAELTMIDKAGKLADEIMGGNPVREDEVEKATTTFLSNLGVAGLAKAGDMRRGNEVVQQSLDKAASEPLQTKRAIDSLTESQEVKENMKSNLDFIAKVKEDLINDGIHPKQHSRYLLESLREKVAKEEMEKKTDPSIQQKDKEIIKEAKEIKERIIAGEDADKIITEKEQKEIDEKNETEIEIQRLTKANELDNKELAAKRKDLDGRVPDDRIKIEKLEQQIKEKNEDFERKLSKLKPKEAELHEEKPVVTPEGIATPIEKVGDEIDTPLGRGVIERMTADGTPIVKLKDGSKLMLTDEVRGQKLQSGVKPIAKDTDVVTVSDALKKHDEVENYTFDDMVNDIDSIANDTSNQKLIDAVEKYRKEQSEDAKLSGRGDMDTAQKEFEKSIANEQTTTTTGNKPAIIRPEENKVGDIVPLKKESTPEIKKLEAERDAKIEEVSKPEVKMEFVTAKDLVNSKDPVRNKEIHDEIKDRFKNLKALIECLVKTK